MTKLARKLGFLALIFYGIGDILGAGIYALVGKVIATAGDEAWLSFTLSGIIALLTGLSYAELSSRIPVSAGAAAFVNRAFPGRLMATLSGIFVLGTGLASSATVTIAFSGYLAQLISVPEFFAQILLIFSLSFLSFWGIHHSSRVNVVLTLIEVSGLLLVLAVGFYFLSPSLLENFWQSQGGPYEITPILSGVTLAFFAFVGFEDLCNLADESKKPEKDIPRAILISLSFATVIYILITLLLQIHLPKEEITHSATPLLLIFEKYGFAWVAKYFSIIAILAISNTGLANLIMASRLLYGMSEESLIPKVFGKVHSKRKTPWLSIAIVFGLVLLLVLTGSVRLLAQTTSLLVLVVFTLVHLSLIKLKYKKETHTGFQIPIVFPALGLIGSAFLVFQYPLQVYLRFLIFLGVGLLVWFFQKRNRS